MTSARRRGSARRSSNTSRQGPIPACFGGNSNWAWPDLAAGELLCRSSGRWRSSTVSSATIRGSSPLPRRSPPHAEGGRDADRGAPRRSPSPGRRQGSRPAMVPSRRSTTTRTGSICCCSMSISMPTPARARRCAPDRMDRPFRQSGDDARFRRDILGILAWTGSTPEAKPGQTREGVSRSCRRSRRRGNWDRQLWFLSPLETVSGRRRPDGRRFRFRAPRRFIATDYRTHKDTAFYRFGSKN